MVAAGNNHSCALRESGTLACWGANGFDGEVPAGAFDSVVSGIGFSCALRDGAATCWGEPDYPDVLTPVAGPFVSIEGGYHHACGLLANGDVRCWGVNEHGQTDSPDTEFVQVSAGYLNSCGVTPTGSITCWGGDEQNQSSPPSGEFISVDMGKTFGCAVDAESSVRCWGSGPKGETNPPTGAFQAVSSGYIHVCGLRTDGRAECWGDDGLGAVSGVP